ncbi:hypothetical protein BDN72DRAFT_965351 [Pluteus cervinus]|uniref:Uncharacterized protein n=1 Tax=Pluteus cervinus TaxID=181527 RepID=A0ACD3A5Z9_9AGAR|nr:hypothetical protein BDN72DRAFT_965351 [Pluteus cervinus]
MDAETISLDVYGRREALKGELDSGTQLDGGSDFLRLAFKDIVSRRAISGFLNQSKSYNAQVKRWHALSSNSSFEEKLNPKFHKIFKEILEYRQFAPEDRKLVFCGSHEVKYRKADLCSHESDPDFMILGRGGRSFKEQKFPNSPTYSQCVSLIQVTHDRNPQSLQSQITLMATYARQCFIEQHNRIKVYAVLLTESTMWLFQYDRAGVTRSASCNIHDDPHTFVRIILGLASDDARVGFDTSIFWERGKRWISTRNQKGRRVTYLVQGDGPISQRDSLIGSSTRCWRVIDPYTNKEYVIKDVWHLMKDDPEVNLLEMAKGLTNVGQLIAAEEDHTKTTPYFRGCSASDYLPTDRAWSRMTLEAYGSTLECFRDGLQLLEAFKNILLAILDLWGRDVLHRDISVNNVLFRTNQTLPGGQAVLIDLDRATRINVAESLLGASSDIGTRAFQSISVLRSDSIRNDAKGRGDEGVSPYPHDYLDDIESLFYVLCWVCYQFESPGIRVNNIPEFITDWASDDPSLSATTKSLFHMFPLPPLPTYFQRGSAYQHLLEMFQQKFLKTYRAKKSGIETTGASSNLKELYQDAQLEFEVILKHVDQAIEEWKRHTPDSPKELPPSPSQDASHGTKRTHIALGTDGLDDAVLPSAKRRKTMVIGNADLTAAPPVSKGSTRRSARAVEKTSPAGLVKPNTSRRLRERKKLERL